MNEWMNVDLGHLCAHHRLHWARRTSWEWLAGWDDTALHIRDRIRNSSPVGMRPSTLPLGHVGFSQYWIFTSEQEKNFFLWNLNARVGASCRIRSDSQTTGLSRQLSRCRWSGGRTRDIRLSQHADLTTVPGPPPRWPLTVVKIFYVEKLQND